MNRILYNTLVVVAVVAGVLLWCFLVVKGLDYIGAAQTEAGSVLAVLWGFAGGMAGLYVGMVLWWERY